MAHNLHINSAGQASMMYVGETPWHKLGKKLDKPATAEEAIHAAGLDYTIRKKPLKAIINGKCHVPVADHYATVRMDTNQVLGVVGSRYEAIQNRDAFSFFDALVDRDEAIYHTAGVLGNGERVWILAQLPGYIKVGKDDVINKYLLLTNSHDGSSLVRCKLSPIRVVCSNTLTAALKGSEQEARIRHTANAVVKLEQAHKILGLTNDLYTQLDYIFNRMQLKRITDKELLDYVKALVPDNPEADSNVRTENIRSIILDLHQSGQGASMCRGSLWGAYNAVTEYTDHVQNSKDASKQLNSVWFGSGEQLKRRAYQLAESML